MKHLIAAVASLLGFSSLVSAQANPMACSGTCTNTHDPSLIRRSDGTYFRFSTNGEIAMHTAPAIGGPWTYRGPAIPGGSSINLAGRTDLWAPDVHLISGTYYMYYAVSTFGSQNSAIGYATSTDLLSWTDHGALGVASSSGKPYNAIDPNLAIDGANMFMTFGSFWNDIYQVPMSSPSHPSGSATQKAFNATGSHSEEGAFLYKNGGFWYLFFSSGQCCGLDTSRPRPGDEYKIMVCRGTSVTGPFTDKAGRACTSSGGTLVLGSHGNVYAPGGQGVFDDPNLGPVLYYHYVNIPNGFSDGAKLFGVNRISFSSGWPVV